MGGSVIRNVHIVANTSSSTEAFARRTNEISKFVSGLGRQCNELERNLLPDMRLTLIRTHPTDKEGSQEGSITRHVLPLAETIGTTNPNNLYRKAGSIEELEASFDPLISQMAAIVRDADVVLLGGTYFVPWCLMKAARRERKPVVLVYAGILSMEITHLPPEMQETLRLMEKDFLDPKIFYVFPSNLTKRTVEKIFGTTLSNSEVVYNGIPPEFLAVTSKSTKEYPIAFVGRNTPVKNPEFLLELANVMDRQIYMVTKSEADNQLIRSLRKAGIVVLEPMDTDRLARFYSSCGIVLSPSHFETYGNVPLEAVSTGTPAMISGSMGVCEVFSMLGLSGYISSFDNPRAVAHKIEAILGRDERVPDEIRRHIREKLSWPRVISRYLEICVQHAFA
ncbi:MAG: glycosyltransferase family 4 protein [Candidatus Micrarchaeota archaeon]